MGELSMPIGLQEILISSLPASGYYLPNFVTEAEEAFLLQKVIAPSLDFPCLRAEQLLT